MDVRLHAWQCSCANRGAAGVDGVTFALTERGGVDGWLEELGRHCSLRPRAHSLSSPPLTARVLFKCPIRYMTYEQALNSWGAAKKHV